MAGLYRNYDPGERNRVKGAREDRQVRALHTASGMTYSKAWVALNAKLHEIGRCDHRSMLPGRGFFSLPGRGSATRHLQLKELAASIRRHRQY
jgi:hypothetical protein